MTKRSQRIGIWVIAIVMGVGSIGIYFVAVLANQNNAHQQAQTQQVYSDYQKAVDGLSAQYYPILSKYSVQVASYDASSITDLKSDDLETGTGDTIGSTTSYSAYYIGWNPSGTIFDQSISGSSLKAPFVVTDNSGVIPGWSKGVVGMKLGGVRELSIPAAQAYGDQSVSADIPANTPLKFIILAIPTPDAVAKYTALTAAASAQ